MKNDVSIDFTERNTDEDWEFFARDYLGKMGFIIELDPGRGHDHGKDLIVSEQMNGRIRTQKFTWLVSCKHFSVSNKSVGVNDEQNIVERVGQHAADGFMSFYSTLASSSLIDRLKDLVRNRNLTAFEIIDRGKIEAKFHRDGLSELAIRYFPDSYRRIRPIQTIWSAYEPLYCEVCGKDVLHESILQPYGAIVAYGKKAPSIELKNEKFEDANKIYKVYVACKRQCDDRIQEVLFKSGYITLWNDIGDLCNPILFMKSIMGFMNSIRNREDYLTDEAYQKIKQIYLILAQRVLRDVNEEDRKRAAQAKAFEDF